MRKKLTATICVFSGFLICVSMLISSVLAATTATATITASVTYTPAIQAKIWLNDGSQDYLIFNNADGESTDATMEDGIITIDGLTSAESGTTFTFKVANYSPEVDFYFGLNLNGTPTSPLAGTTDIIVEDTYDAMTSIPIGGVDYKYNTTLIVDNNKTQVTAMSVTPEIVIPVTLNFGIILFEYLNN
ncbi:MAG: hypothetical protein IKT27_02720 [Clostridia bacterium]|nr:hypothetical protein [Clostridia bacterium]